MPETPPVLPSSQSQNTEYAPQWKRAACTHLPNYWLDTFTAIFTFLHHLHTLVKFAFLYISLSDLTKGIKCWRFSNFSSDLFPNHKNIIPRHIYLKLMVKPLKTCNSKNLMEYVGWSLRIGYQQSRCSLIRAKIWNKFVNRSLLLQEAMLEVDIDDSGTVDFFEFLCVARLIAQGKGRYKASDQKNKRIYERRERESMLLS